MIIRSLLRRMGSINCKELRQRVSSTSDQNFEGTIGDLKPTDQSTTMQSNTEIIKNVCNVNDIAENEMKEFELSEDNKVLVIKKNNKFHAIGTKCSHYGAPLIKGALGKDRIRCPWHGACFNLETGDIEDFPGLDSIPCYKVRIENNMIKVIAKKSDLESNKRIKLMKKKDLSDERCFIVIGGGPSAAVCVETLRQEGFTGRIVMICKENALPYDRVKISKSFQIDINKIQLRDINFYEENDIEILKNVEVKNVNTTKKTIDCSNGYSIKYDKLYVATGCKPRLLNIPGSNLKNIMTVRDYTDSLKIFELLNPEIEVVCLGASFIGLESAASIAGKVKKITVVGKDEFPLQSSFGKEIGERVLKLFTEKGVNMLMKSGITECIGDENNVIKSVKLTDGNVINCDLLILGIGSTFHTEFLKDSDIKLNSNGSIDTDLHLMTNISDVYVGGDIANAPVFSVNNKKIAIGHYQLAQYHGKIAAMNMVDKITELKAVPFFFTLLFGKGLRYSGYGKAVDIMIDGDLESMTFLAIYFDKDDNVIAMASCNRDPIVAQFAEFQSQGKHLHKNDLKNGILEWTKLII